MKIYRIQYNADKLLKIGETIRNRYFTTIEGANEVFDACKSEINLSNGEFIALDSLDITQSDLVCGELKIRLCETLRYWSDDTKINI